ncbi:hypothetical protein GCM10009555_003000 [Acrocarpospora macrocephala]|uniref:alpha-L-rhamnosidase n=1 Tax=Acrocarpospora macrocephala TaxID=150177 RepID=A0A5M3WR44_9ACTN|nr:hypothetical protein Amac_053720 [Acrocarpospora macrocephala]
MNGRHAPLGMDARTPEFGWRLPAVAADQVAWEVQVTEGPDVATGRRVWETGRVEGAERSGVSYGGDELESGAAYTWRVRVWEASHDEPGPWSEPARFETGLLQTSDWSAAWVTDPARPAEKDPAAMYLRGVAQLPADVVRARAYVSSLGWHRLFVNGHDITGTALVPRWTPFDHEVEYVTYDVTSAFARGANVVALALGDGRFRGSLGFENHRAVYGDRLAGLLQVHLELADGTTQVTASDGTWRAAGGRITSADPKTGERVDLRIPDDDWLRSAEHPARFRPVEVLSEPRTLVAESVERVQQVGELAPQRIRRLPSGKQVVDFGQNFAGVVRIRLRGPAGARVRLTHSEIERPDGELDLDYIHPFPVGRWYQRDVVILDGDDAFWQPWFTIHGFRYVSVEGLDAGLASEDVRGIVISSDLEQTGQFHSSDARLNQLWSNVGWSLRSNFMDTSTDGPTRERSEWTGDIQVFAPTATAYVGAQSYLRRYLRSLALEQAVDGTIPVVIPSSFSTFSGGPRGQLKSAGTAAGWSDASVLIPWTLYRYYGDVQVLRDQYDSMVAWVEHCERRAAGASSRARRRKGTGRPEIERYIVDTGFQFGEWLRPGENPFLSAIDGRRRGAVVATAYFERSARTLSRIADVSDDRRRSGGSESSRTARARRGVRRSLPPTDASAPTGRTTTCAPSLSASSTRPSVRRPSNVC